MNSKVSCSPLSQPLGLIKCRLGIRDQIENEKLAVGATGRSRWGSFKELFMKGNRNRVAIGLTLMMCQNMTGVNVSLSPETKRFLLISQTQYS